MNYIERMDDEIERLLPIEAAARVLRDKLRAIRVDPAYAAELAALDAVLDGIPSAKPA